MPNLHTYLHPRVKGMQTRHLPSLLRFIPQFAQICIVFALSKFEANPFFRPVIYVCSYIALFLFCLGNKICIKVFPFPLFQQTGCYINKTLWERTHRRRGECGGIVRNHVFPDTLPYKYPYFSTFV